VRAVSPVILLHQPIPSLDQAVGDKGLNAFLSEHRLNIRASYTNSTPNNPPAISVNRGVLISATWGRQELIWVIFHSKLPIIEITDALPAPSNTPWAVSRAGVRCSNGKPDMTGSKNIMHIRRWLNVMADHRYDIPNNEQSDQCNHYDGPDFIPKLLASLSGCHAFQPIQREYMRL
jgi:hypothetical protein